MKNKEIKLVAKQNMERIDRKFEIEEILPRIPDCLLSNKNYKREILDGHLINFNSLRLITFKLKGITCIECGIKGSFFVKERFFSIGGPYHLNLYALDENNNEILMTRDHIVPKFKDGKNSIDNMQTMCRICNQLKDHPQLTICPICNGEKKAIEMFCKNCVAVV